MIITTFIIFQINFNNKIIEMENKYFKYFFKFYH